MVQCPDTDDEDAYWLLGRAKEEHTNWRGSNCLKARPESGFTKFRFKDMTQYPEISDQWYAR